MKIRGVFSMSIINRLKSLFKEEKKDMEEINIENTDVDETSSDFNDPIVTGTKTTVPRTDVVKDGDSTKDIELKFKKDVSSIDESVEETLPIIEEDEPSNDEEIPNVESADGADENDDVASDVEEEVPVEESLDVEENTSSEEEDDNTDDETESTEKVDEEENKEKKER